MSETMFHTHRRRNSSRFKIEPCQLREITLTEKFYPAEFVDRRRDDDPTQKNVCGEIRGTL
jgi:hypothetical protein